MKAEKLELEEEKRKVRRPSERRSKQELQRFIDEELEWLEEDCE